MTLLLITLLNPGCRLAMTVIVFRTPPPSPHPGLRHLCLVPVDCEMGELFFLFQSSEPTPQRERWRWCCRRGVYTVRWRSFLSKAPNQRHRERGGVGAVVEVVELFFSKLRTNVTERGGPGAVYLDIYELKWLKTNKEIITLIPLSIALSRSINLSVSLSLCLSVSSPLLPSL
jgi:hypothetical protein